MQVKLDNQVNSNHLQDFLWKMVPCPEVPHTQGIRLNFGNRSLAVRVLFVFGLLFPFTAFLNTGLEFQLTSVVQRETQTLTP